MPVYNCKHCRDPFSAREADRRRGWARFCSKSCKAKHQERRTGQNAAYHARQSERALDKRDAILDSVTTSHGQWEAG